MNWVFNWDLWSATKWTDIGTFQYDALPLVLNRVTWLLAAVLLTVLHRALVRAPRKRDTRRTRCCACVGARRARWRRSRRSCCRRSSRAACSRGRSATATRGAAAKKATLDYWRKNIQTWKDAPAPVLAGVDLDVSSIPKIHDEGLVHGRERDERAMARFPVTVNPRWKSSRSPRTATRCTENRAGLVIDVPARAASSRASA